MLSVIPLNEHLRQTSLILAAYLFFLGETEVEARPGILRRANRVVLNQT